MSAQSVKKPAEPPENMALKASEDKFKFMFEHSSIAKSFTLPSGEINVNQAFCELLGYSQDELQNKRWQEITHPDDIELTKKALDKVLSGEQDAVRLTKRYLHKAGSVIWAEVSTSLRRDETGQPLYFMTEVNNITARKQAEAALHASEKNYRELIDGMNETVWIIDFDGNLIDVNKTAVEVLGYSKEDLLSDGLYAIDATLKKEDIQALAKAMPADKLQVFESTHKTKEGRVFPVEISSSLVIYQEKRAILSIARNITARKQAEEVLRESEERYKLMFESAPLAINITRGTDIIYANPSYLKMFGFSNLDELKNFTPLELFAPELRGQILENIQRRAKGLPVPNSYEAECFRKDRTRFPILMHLTRTTFADGPATVGFIIDITERKQVERKLVENEKKYRTLVENIQTGLVVHAPDTSILYSNLRASQLLGLTPDQMRGKTAIDPAWCFIDEDGARMPLDQYPVNQALAAETAITDLILGILRPDREGPTWVQCNAHQDLDLDGKLHQVVVTFVDITARKQAEVALQKSEARMVSAIRAAGLRLYEEEGAGRENRQMTFFDAGMRELLGIPADQDHRARDYWIEHIHPDDLQNIMIPEIARFEDQGENLVSAEYRYLNEKRGVIWFRHVAHAIKRNDKGDVLRLVGAIYNITERKQAEEKLHAYSEHLEELVETRTHELREAQEQLIQQERLAVLGRLAGGVSQELRNPLGIINNAIYYLRLVQPEADEKVREYLGIIETEAHNADKIVSDLLDFSSNELVDREPIAVSELVSDALQHFPIPENVQVTLNLPENLPNIYVDPRQMTQVLGNLVLNACQAMNNGGRLTVDGRQLTVDGQSSVVIAIKDTGSGIPPENMKKLFEPLFTTKPKGIGLGLAVSKKLVEANGGRIEVESEVGKGSTFTVWLPVKQ